MISLFLDTSSNYLNIAVLRDGKILKEYREFFLRDLSKYALYKVKEILDGENLKPNDVDEIICVNGPGSFTGLRVGTTIAKTFAWGLNKDLYGVSSLFNMACSLIGGSKDYIIPIIDARRNYLYAAIYDKNGNIVLNDSYISKEELLDKVKDLKGSFDFVSINEISGIDSTLFVPKIDVLYQKFVKQKVNPHTFVPNYLKKTEAEENLAK